MEKITKTGSGAADNASQNILTKKERAKTYTKAGGYHILKLERESRA